MKAAHFIIAAFYVLLTSSCGNSNPNAVAQLGDAALTMEELRERIPNNISAEDSAALAQEIIQSWLKDALVLQEAEKMSDEEKLAVERRIEDYRKSLLIYSFEQDWIKKNMDTVVTNEQIQSYYDSNKSSLKVNEHYLKLKYCALPEKTQDIKKMSDAFASEDMATWEAYCQQLGAKYYAKTDAYINWEQFAKFIPIAIPDRSLFLTQTTSSQQIVLNGEIFWFKVSSYLLPGDQAPLEMVRDNIASILLNIRKQEVLQKMKNDLYEKAKSEGKIE
jgi:predicted HTH domain antitoxin